jgi:hypothetical protein
MKLTLSAQRPFEQTRAPQDKAQYKAQDKAEERERNLTNFQTGIGGFTYTATFESSTLQREAGGGCSMQKQGGIVEGAPRFNSRVQIFCKRERAVRTRSDKVPGQVA